MATSRFALPTPVVTIFVSQAGQVCCATFLTVWFGPLVALSTTVTKTSPHNPHRWVVDAAGATAVAATALDGLPISKSAPSPFWAAVAPVKEIPRANVAPRIRAGIRLVVFISFWFRFVFSFSLNIFWAPGPHL